MKKELRYLYRAFFEYKKGFLYIAMRFFVAPRILRSRRPIEKPENDATLSMHMLFGAKDFILALWSLASWYRVSSIRGKLYLHSDGTLTESHKKILMELFPSATIVDARDVVETHKDFFDTHPDLREFRTTYTKFQSKKLLDPYLSSTRPNRLVLDSDILWFRDPADIREALAKGVPSAYMMSDASGTEGGFSYVTFKDGTRITDEIASYNSGITLYAREQFDLAKFSEYLGKVDYRNARFTDQACYATIFSPNLVRLPEKSYIIKGALKDYVVARHYTNPSRAKFYCYGLNFISDDILRELL